VELGRLKTILAKTYIRNIVKLRERSIGITETRQKRPWKINVRKREMEHTHLERWPCASGK
jgi:hypothetical protein